MEVAVKKLILLVVIAGCLFTTVAGAQEVAAVQGNVRSELAGQLLGLMDVEKNLKQSLDMVKKMQMEQLKTMTPHGQDSAKMQEMQSKIMNLVAEEMSWEKMRADYGIYAVGTGRICVAALNTKNIDYVVKAVAAVLKG